jgi:ubiquinone/menaquinone biosynthesis C-methylase UbiE
MGLRASKQRVHEEPSTKELEKYWRFMKKAEYRVLEGKVGIKQVYDEMADLYDYSEYLYWTRRMEEGEEETIRRWTGKIQSPLIDVGCGTGCSDMMLRCIQTELWTISVLVRSKSPFMSWLARFVKVDKIAPYY